MLCVLIETGDRLCLKRWTKLEALVVLIHIRIPFWFPGSAETYRKESVYRLCLLFSASEVLYIGLISDLPFDLIIHNHVNPIKNVMYSL
jgi:hypothetical protein